MPYADKTKRRIHTAWKNMIARCEKKEHTGYAGYGGRGINVCNEWHQFLPFYHWSLDNGYNDSLTIDRIDNDKGYSPENCRWVSPKANSRNRRNNHVIVFNGESLCIAEWAERLGISFQALDDRLHSDGWTLEQALTTTKYGRLME